MEIPKVSSPILYLARINQLQDWISGGLEDAPPEVLENPWQLVAKALLEEPDAGSDDNLVTLSTHSQS